MSPAPARPELANRIFTEVGARNLRFLINFGFVFGFLLGVPVSFLTKGGAALTRGPLPRAGMGLCTPRRCRAREQK
jgi:hypothetical protein